MLKKVEIAFHSYLAANFSSGTSLMNISIFWEYFHRFIIFYLLWLPFWRCETFIYFFFTKILTWQLFPQERLWWMGLGAERGLWRWTIFYGWALPSECSKKIFNFSSLMCFDKIMMKSFIICFHCQVFIIRGESCEAWQRRWKGWNSNRGPLGHCKRGLWKNVNDIKLIIKLIKIIVKY